MGSGIDGELGIQPQQKVHAPVPFGSLQVPEGSETRQVKVVLDDECAKLLVNFLPKRLKPGCFTAEAVFNLCVGFQ